MELVSQEEGLSDRVPDVDPATLPYGQRLTWVRQERFLDAFSKGCTVTKPVAVAGVNIHSVQYWDKGDKIGFTEGYRHARRAFVNKLENMVLDRPEVPKGNQGSDVLRSAKFNNEDPDPWNRNQNVTHDADNELIKALQSVQREAKDLGEQQGDGSQVNQGIPKDLRPEVR